MNKNSVYITRQIGEVCPNTVWKEFLLDEITGKPLVFQDWSAAIDFLHDQGIINLAGITIELVDPPDPIEVAAAKIVDWIICAVYPKNLREE